MTDRSSEERSRFEKWWEKEMQAEPSADSVSKSYARDAWMVRAALEDRQEAAPLSDEDLEGSSKVRMCLKCGATKGMRRCPECGDYADPGVPSEATKENL